MIESSVWFVIKYLDGNIKFPEFHPSTSLNDFNIYIDILATTPGGSVWECQPWEWEAVGSNPSWNLAMILISLLISVVIHINNYREDWNSQFYNNLAATSWYYQLGAKGYIMDSIHTYIYIQCMVLQII